jgi:gluconokinase
MKEGLIAVDIGTSSCRAILFDQQLQQHAQANYVLAFDRPHPGWAEQHPEEVLEGVMACIQQVLQDADQNEYQVAGICFSAAVCSLLLLDERDEPLTPASIWADRRASNQAQQLLVEPGLELYHRTGCPIHASYLPAKLVWWHEMHPEVLSKAQRLVSLKSYVLAQLCGSFVEDMSIASASGCLNVNNLNWEDLALKGAMLGAERLAEVVPTTHILSLRAEAAARLGVHEGLQLICGAGDGVLSNLGAGAVAPGQVVTMVGSSGAVRISRQKPWLDPTGRTWCYPLIGDRNWVVGGANNCGGLVLDWIAQDLLGLPVDMPVQSLADLAAEAPAGSDGLVLLPTLMGERSPLWDEYARGVLFGLSDSHHKAHIIRSTMEGILYSLHSIYRILKDADDTSIEIRATGGYAQSPFWLGMQASIFQSPILVPKSAEGSALGAAILGWVALGQFPDVETGARMVEIEKEVMPVEKDFAIYARGLETHQALYDQLKDYLPESGAV